MRWIRLAKGYDWFLVKAGFGTLVTKVQFVSFWCENTRYSLHVGHNELYGCDRQKSEVGRSLLDEKQPCPFSHASLKTVGHHLEDSSRAENNSEDLMI